MVVTFLAGVVAGAPRGFAITSKSTKIRVDIQTDATGKKRRVTPKVISILIFPDESADILLMGI